jgi:coatomer protein complex subunit epsilon
MADLLYDTRTFVAVGDYAQAISSGTALADSRLNEAARIEKDYLVARAQIGLGQFDSVLRDPRFSSASAPIALQACRILAQYSAAQTDAERANCLAKVEEWSSSYDTLGPHASAICGVLAMREGKWDRAMHALHRVQSLEMSSLLGECFLQVARRDLAEKTLLRMRQVDEENVQTHLFAARLAENPSDAESVLQEMVVRYGETVLLLNGLAVTAMQQQHWDEAEKILLRALAKRSNDPETLLNMAVVAMHTHKPRDLVQRYVAQLRAIAPGHSWVRQWDERQRALDELVAPAH